MLRMIIWSLEQGKVLFTISEAVSLSHELGNFAWIWKAFTLEVFLLQLRVRGCEMDRVLAFSKRTTLSSVHYKIMCAHNSQKRSSKSSFIQLTVKFYAPKAITFIEDGRE